MGLAETFACRKMGRQLPLVEENEMLAPESYEVGQIGRGDLLLVRRETLDARRAFIGQLIETRLDPLIAHALQRGNRHRYDVLSGRRDLEPHAGGHASTCCGFANSTRTACGEGDRKQGARSGC